MQYFVYTCTAMNKRKAYMPKKNATSSISFRVTPRQHQWMAELARKRGISLTQLLISGVERLSRASAQ